MEFPMKSYHMGQYYKNGPSNPRVFISPSKYIQGPGVIQYTGEYICSISPLKKERVCLILGSKGGMQRYGDQLTSSLQKKGIEYVSVVMGHQCSWEEINRICSIARDMKHCDFVIAFGGGKAVDLGKGVATSLDIGCVIIPTLASNDAPTSSLSVVYDEKTDERQGAYFNYKNPDMIIVDTEIIAHAPPRTIVAGMGDALATFVEARCASLNPLGESSVRVRPTLTAMAIAEACTATILKEGKAAIEAVENKRVDEHLEAVVEANTLMSGLGFENGGVSGAHALGVGVTALPGTEKKYLHGELVAVGVMTELVMEGRVEECKELGTFFTEVGLPVCWKQLDVDVDNDEQVSRMLNSCFEKFYAIKNMPFEKTIPVYQKGMKEAEKLCSQILEEKGQTMWLKYHSSSV